MKALLQGPDVILELSESAQDVQHQERVSQVNEVLDTFADDAFAIPYDVLSPDFEEVFVRILAVRRRLTVQSGQLGPKSVRLCKTLEQGQ